MIYSRIPLAELDTEAFDNVESPQGPLLAKQDLDPVAPGAIFGEKDGIMRVCMYCPTKLEAEIYCRRLGLQMSHGVCDHPGCRELMERDFRTD